MYKPNPLDAQEIQCKDLYSEQDLQNLSNIIETFVDEKLLQKGIIIDMALRTVSLPNQKKALREIAYHSGAAAVVPVDAEGNVYLVYQHRSVLNKITLEIPAGKMDEGETDPKACAIRELAEETGLIAKNIELLHSMDSTPGFCTEFVNIYLATDLEKKEAQPDADEFLGVIKIPLQEALRRVESGELSDAKTALGLLLAARKFAL